MYWVNYFFFINVFGKEQIPYQRTVSSIWRALPLHLRQEGGYSSFFLLVTHFATFQSMFCFVIFLKLFNLSSLFYFSSSVCSYLYFSFFFPCLFSSITNYPLQQSFLTAPLFLLLASFSWLSFSTHFDLVCQLVIDLHHTSWWSLCLRVRCTALICLYDWLSKSCYTFASQYKTFNSRNRDRLAYNKNRSEYNATVFTLHQENPQIKVFRKNL